MPVCITGMHRSGTSLMARLLNLSGLYLGRESELLGAGPDNPEGHWEHEGLMQVNEELLAECGGGWDYPPVPPAFDDVARTARFVPRALAHLAGFAGHSHWGWKDPRNSLTLPFWRHLVDPIHVVVCVRHPLEVALSLRMRNGSTIAFGLALWTAYAEALQETTSPGGRVVTHFERYQGDPAAEIGRVAPRIGLVLDEQRRLQIEQSVRPELRHSRFTFQDLLDVKVSHRVCVLYRDFCLEADAKEQCEVRREIWTPARPREQAVESPGQFDYEAMENLRRRL